MTLPRLALSVIGDEIGPSLDEMISFAHEHGLKRLDMRTVDGRNLLGMTTDEVIEISRTLEKAGLTVPTFVSPLFKWPAPGKSAAGGKVDFAFDPQECPAEDPIDHAIEIAVILGAPHMRIFSYLRYDGFRPGRPRPTASEPGCWSLANHYDIVVAARERAGLQYRQHRRARGLLHPAEPTRGADETIRGNRIYLRPLVDIANAWSTGERPSDADIAVLAPLVTTRSISRTAIWRPAAPCRWATATCRGRPNSSGCWAASRREVLASIETHCPQDRRNATARSVAALRRIAGEIGVEIVRTRRCAPTRS